MYIVDAFDHITAQHSIVGRGYGFHVSERESESIKGEMKRESK